MVCAGSRLGCSPVSVFRSTARSRRKKPACRRSPDPWARPPNNQADGAGAPEAHPPGGKGRSGHNRQKRPPMVCQVHPGEIPAPGQRGYAEQAETDLFAQSIIEFDLTGQYRGGEDYFPPGHRAFASGLTIYRAMGLAGAATHTLGKEQTIGIELFLRTHTAGDTGEWDDSRTLGSGKILPGFMMLLGSIACLMDRMVSRVSRLSSMPI